MLILSRHSSTRATVYSRHRFGNFLVPFFITAFFFQQLVQTGLNMGPSKQPKMRKISWRPSLKCPHGQDLQKDAFWKRRNLEIYNGCTCFILFSEVQGSKTWIKMVAKVEPQDTQNQKEKKHAPIESRGAVWALKSNWEGLWVSKWVSK